MIIKDLLIDYPYVLNQGSDSIQVRHMTYDSRKVESGSLFVCIKGFKQDGHDYIDQAVEKGACAILVQRDIPEVPGYVTVIKVDDTRKAMPWAASRFYGQPSKQVNLIAVTGTNGKTSVTYIISSILACAGRKTGIIGTLDNRIGDKVLTLEKTTYTTPESADLHDLFKQMADEQVEDVLMEATSMALDLHRVDACDLDIGIFTNLTQDHLDDHKTMDNYKKAKLKLFTLCRHGIINADDPVSKDILLSAACDILTYGIHQEADLKASNVRFTPQGVAFSLHYKAEKREVKLGIPGKFSVYNALAAIGACHLSGLTLDQIVKGLESIQGVRGRFQTIPSTQGFSVIVDYAHTPDALENVLSTVKEFATQQIITVFGCGGDRDRTKRPIMGQIAGEYSTYCVLTSDNPRTEEPSGILDDIEAGIAKSECPYTKIADRKEAISRALRMAKPGDVVVIAGKGHETYQELRDRKIHFDDAEVTRELLQTV